jgi:hypothetical protein
MGEVNCGADTRLGRAVAIKICARDLKPAQHCGDEDPGVKVLDFGLAKLGPAKRVRKLGRCPRR